MTKIALASDHAGYILKEAVKRHLKELGYEPVDFGTNSTDSCDYPDFAHPAAKSVIKGDCEMGVAVCGSGNGMQITLNKYPQIRAALCWLPELSALARRHNDANFLVLPARFISEDLGLEITDNFLTSQFEGGRHENRVKKITQGIPVEGEVMG